MIYRTKENNNMGIYGTALLAKEKEESTNKRPRNSSFTKTNYYPYHGEGFLILILPLRHHQGKL